jgi:hypothetical protein
VKTDESKTFDSIRWEENQSAVVRAKRILFFFFIVVLLQEKSDLFRDIKYLFVMHTSKCSAHILNNSRLNS